MVRAWDSILTEPCVPLGAAGSRSGAGAGAEQQEQQRERGAGAAGAAGRSSGRSSGSNRTAGIFFYGYIIRVPFTVMVYLFIVLYSFLKVKIQSSYVFWKEWQHVLKMYGQCCGYQLLRLGRRDNCVNKLRFCAALKATPLRLRMYLPIHPVFFLLILCLLRRLRQLWGYRSDNRIFVCENRIMVRTCAQCHISRTDGVTGGRAIFGVVAPHKPVPVSQRHEFRPAQRDCFSQSRSYQLR